MLASALRRGRFHLGYDASGRRGRVGQFVIPCAKRTFADSVLAATTLIKSNDGCIDTGASIPRPTLETSESARHPLSTAESYHSTPTPQTTKITFSACAEAAPHLLHVPKFFLCDVHKRNGVKTEGTFLVLAKEDNGKTWFTATFTDSITNETFSSGLAREVNAKTQSSSALNPPLHLADTKILDGKVYYRQLRYAEHAAAARAIDCYIFREQSPTLNDLQLCLESPYSTMEEGISQVIDYGALMVKKNGILDAKKCENLPDFSSLANSMPFLLHVPKLMMINALQMCRIDHSGSFYTQTRTHDGTTWWTATFTNPITREIFSSGLTQEVKAEKKVGATMNPSIHLASAMIMDGKVYYKHSCKMAEHAAAARAIDCYIFRERGAVSSKKWRLCLENPYSTAEEGAAQTIDYDTLLVQRNAFANDGSTSSPMSCISRSFSSTVKCLPQKLHVPMDFLNIAFLDKYGLYCDRYEVKKRYHENEYWYTATVMDPITKERYPSGLGNPVRVIKPDHMLKTPLYRADVKILDGEVYYAADKLAKHAAAARAIDCYIFRERGSVSSKKWRLCLENPYSTAEEGAAQTIDYDTLLVQKNAFANNDSTSSPMSSINLLNKRNNLSVDEVEMCDVDLTQLIPKDELSVNEDEVCEVDSSDYDLPVLTISFAEGTNKVTKVHNSLSTMGRILEIWTETHGLDPFSEQSYSELTTHGEHKSPNERIDSILNWYERINNEPKNEGEALALVKLCSSILAALGKANGDMHLEDKARHVNVQKDAKIILDRIISVSTAFENKTFLGPDTFNAYIRCLDRENPSRSAELAENLLKSMLSNEKMNGFNLPLPNVGTYNAVLGLWALVEGDKGQSCANRVYSLLEAASTGSEDEISLRPNKETFKTLLSANSKKDGQFSFEQAKFWLHSFHSLIPDADVFGAALSTLSINNSNPADPRYANSWISSGDQYIGGFKSVDTHSKEEAENISKWLLYAEECGINPNAETYEAVIRKWIKTGTKDGLLIAEDWAKRAVSSGSRIRIETFHPIIAAWALCQFERAPARVEEWINQLNGLSKTKPHLKPGLNTLSAQIISWRNVQAGIVTKANGAKQSSFEEQVNGNSIEAVENSDKSKMLRDVEMTFAAAESCMQNLKDLFPGSKLDSVQDIEAMISMLTHTIEAWGCASQFAVFNPTGSVSLDTSHGVHEMLKVARLFDAKINIEGTDEKEAQKNLHLMGETYAKIISQLHQIDSASDSDTTKTCHFLRELADVEKMLQDYDFYSRSHFPQGNFTPQSKALRHRMYEEILRGCALVKSSADNGHVVRLCRLIMEQLSWLDERCIDNENGNEKDDITEIFVGIALLAGTIVTNPHERTYVLTVIWNNAKHFFQRRTKHESSSYATVDRARLIGAMRMAMKDSEITEPFLRNFDKRPPRRSGRGNTWLAFVEELLGNKNDVTIKKWSSKGV